MNGCKFVWNIIGKKIINLLLKIETCSRTLLLDNKNFTLTTQIADLMEAILALLKFHTKHMYGGGYLI